MPKTKCIYKKLLKHFIYKLLYIYISLWTSPSPRENYKSIFNSTLQMQSNIRNLWAMSNSLQPHGLQHARPLCPSPSPKICPSSYPLHWWYHLAISPSDALFSFCLQLFPASGKGSWLFPWVSCLHQMTKNTGVSVSASVLPMSEYSGLISLKTGLVSLLSRGLSGIFSNTTVQRHQFFSTLPSLLSSSHNRYMTAGIWKVWNQD